MKASSLDCGMWGVVPWPEIEPRPLHWEHGVESLDHQGSPSTFSLQKKQVLRVERWAAGLPVHPDLRDGIGSRGFASDGVQQRWRPVLFVSAFPFGCEEGAGEDCRGLRGPSRVGGTAPRRWRHLETCGGEICQEHWVCFCQRFWEKDQGWQTDPLYGGS